MYLCYMAPVLLHREKLQPHEQHMLAPLWETEVMSLEDVTWWACI